MKLKKRFWMPDKEWHFSNETSKRDLITYQGAIRYVASKLTTKGCAIDAGAHIGMATVHLSQYFDEVIAFEPCRENFECLARNCEGIDNIKPMMIGLGEKNKKATLQSVKDNSGAGYIDDVENLQYRPEESEDGEKYNIRISTIDAFDIDCSLIKIDVQGYERKVIAGARQTIKRNKPLLLIEMEKDKSREKALEESRALKKELLQMGYLEIVCISRDTIFVHCTEEERVELQRIVVKTLKVARQELNRLMEMRD